MRYQILTWLRSQRLVVVLVAFAFSGVTSPLVAAHLADIVAALGEDGDITVVAADPTWQTVLSSYFRNASQLALIVTAYVVAKSVALGPDPALRIHYLSKATRSGQVFLPRWAVAVAATSAGAVLGVAIAYYETAVLVSGADLSAAAPAMAVQVVGVVLLAGMAGCLGFLTNSPFVSTLLVALGVFAGGFLESLPTVGRWSPSRLATPDGLLAEDSLADYGPAALTATLILVGLLAAATLPRSRPGMPISTPASTDVVSDVSPAMAAVTRRDAQPVSGTAVLVGHDEGSTR